MLSPRDKWLYPRPSFLEQLFQAIEAESDTGECKQSPEFERVRYILALKLWEM